MNQTAAQVASAPLTHDERELSRAVSVLSQHEFLRPLLRAAFADGYEFSIDPNIKAMAVHNQKSKVDPIPNIRFQPGQTWAQYAEALCHELNHYAIARAGRIFGVKLSPIANMAMRLCEEAVVVTMTSDLMYQAAHGINMKNGNSYPELWEANLNSSFYTAKAYGAHANNNARAVQESFDRFYTMPAPVYRKEYQIYTMNYIINENEDTLLNPQNFIWRFNPSDFLKFVPVPYNEILKPCLKRMDPTDQQHLILGFETAHQVEILCNRRRAAFGIRQPHLKVFVENGCGGAFPWQVGRENLAANKIKSEKQSRATPVLHGHGALALAS